MFKRPLRRRGEIGGNSERGGLVGTTPESAREFDLAINLKTARTLGIASPAPLRLRATELVE